MNDLTITVSGWAATDPRHVVGPTGTAVTSFRLASTSRYFDRGANAWVDGPTEWFTVRTFRSAAVTVMNSIAKGQPVVVTGRLRTNEWESEAGARTDLVIDASALGHDLTRGVARFTRATGDASLGVGPHARPDGADAGSGATGNDTPAAAASDDDPLSADDALVEETADAPDESLVESTV